MKIIAIGDTHGRDVWKEIVEKEHDADKFIFIGDYFDTHEKIEPIYQMSNFNTMMNYRKQMPNRIIFLFGNHDYHYSRGVSENYTGFQAGVYYNIQDLLEKNKQYFQMCYIQDNYLFTHAGVTKTWMKKYNLTHPNEINQLFWENIHAFRFQGLDIYGDDRTQSPIWVRHKSLHKDKIDGYIQVIGHTQTENIQFKKTNSGKLSAIYIDALPEYLIIEDNEPRIGKINE